MVSDHSMDFVATALGMYHSAEQGVEVEQKGVGFVKQGMLKS